MLVLGKFKDDYWLVCGPMRNEPKLAGNLAQLDCTVQSVHKQFGQSSRNMNTKSGILVVVHTLVLIAMLEKHGLSYMHSLVDLINTMAFIISPLPNV